jgi:hypothetical protein
MKKPPRIAVIDSGVHADHPHVRGVAGGVGILADGSESPDFVDRLGHGTAVTAAIREKVPDAEIYVVRIFDRRLATNIETLVHALEWCAARQFDFVNLSLGTPKPEHEQALQPAVDRVTKSGAQLIAAYGWLPGSLPGVIPVELDWDCPRDEFRTAPLPDGRTLYRASPYPRPIPNVPVDRNLKGISFAVANVTGLLAQRPSPDPCRSAGPESF